ncbi:MAG: Transforming protein p29 precursor [Candidatus Heimdallarchaeota archaeon LC_3]|nr:MAG: Transforming protein p29 precursor [Candidatus Heimdallarchaeota archaeon LC_3]
MSKKTILIINNNFSDINSLTRIFENDYEITVANSALMGIKKTRENKYSFVVIDENIDDGQGLVVLDLIRDAKIGIPILSIDETFDLDSLLIDSVTSTSFDVIKKPFNKDEILNHLDTISLIEQEEITTKNIAILGMDNVGKTSLVTRFLHNEFIETKPTFGLNLETYASDDDCYFKLFDLGGQEIYKDTLWQDVIKKAHGLVFVVDSSASEDLIKKSSKWFWQILKDWLPKNIPLLLIANKNDIPGMNLSSIIDFFKLDKLTLSSHPFNFISTSAKTGQGVGSFKWLVSKLTKTESKPQNLSYSSIIVLNNEFQEVLKLNKTPNELDVQNFVPIIRKEFYKNDFNTQFVKINEETSILVERLDNNYLVLLGSFNENTTLKKFLCNLFKKIRNLILPIPDLSIRKEQFNWIIQQEFPDFYFSQNSVLFKEKIKEMGLIFSHWDENYGPKVISSYFQKPNSRVNTSDLAITCFMTAVSIFGHQGQIDPCFVTIPLKYNNLEARIYFDSIKDPEVRGGQRIYSIITLLPDLAVINLPVHDQIIKSNFDKYKESESLVLEKLHQTLVNEII